MTFCVKTLTITKTLKFKLHYLTTNSKFEKLEQLSKKLTYCTNRYLKIIFLEDATSMTELDMLTLSEGAKYDLKATGVSTGFLQACRDKALWLYNSYLKKGRIPQIRGKICPQLDYRTFQLVRQEKDISPIWLKLSTLEKRHRMMLPLHASQYHLEQLSKGKVQSCEIVKKDKDYYAHITIRKEVPIRAKEKPAAVLAVDLGVRNQGVAVLLRLDKEIAAQHVRFFKAADKNQRLNDLDQYVAKLRRLEKWKELRKIRNKRLNFANDFDHKFARDVSGLANQYAEDYNVTVIIGNLRGFRGSQCRGNGNKILRKITQKWSYARVTGFIKYKCNELGIECVTVSETYTSKTCHRCGSRNTERPTQGLFQCKSCDSEYNADLNAAINIGLKYILGSDQRFDLVDCSEPVITRDEEAVIASEARRFVALASE